MLAGTAAAIGLEGLLRSFVFGVRATDAVTLAGAGLVLILAASIASFVPALEIVRLNPSGTLRSE